MRIRPQVLIIGIVIGSIAAFALQLGQDNVASVAVAGLVAVIVKLSEQD